jgi:hypothetical protein
MWPYDKTSIDQNLKVNFIPLNMLVAIPQEYNSVMLIRDAINIWLNCPKKSITSVSGEDEVQVATVKSQSVGQHF